MLYEFVYWKLIELCCGGCRRDLRLVLPITYKLCG